MLERNLPDCSHPDGGWEREGIVMQQKFKIKLAALSRVDVDDVISRARYCPRHQAYILGSFNAQASAKSESLIYRLQYPRDRQYRARSGNPNKIPLS